MHSYLGEVPINLRGSTETKGLPEGRLEYLSKDYKSLTWLKDNSTKEHFVLYGCMEGSALVKWNSITLSEKL